MNSSWRDTDLRTVTNKVFFKKNVENAQIKTGILRICQIVKIKIFAVLNKIIIPHDQNNYNKQKIQLTSCIICGIFKVRKRKRITKQTKNRKIAA